jgi:hypothetical protein
MPAASSGCCCDAASPKPPAARQAALLLDAGHPLLMVPACWPSSSPATRRLHNTALWQRISAPSRWSRHHRPATPVEVIDTRRVAHVVVQTEKGLYFLTGAKYVPEAGAKLVVQANERWDLYLCAADGEPLHEHPFLLRRRGLAERQARRSGAHRRLLRAARARHADSRTLRGQAADGGAGRHGQAQARHRPPRACRIRANGAGAWVCRASR